MVYYYQDDKQAKEDEKMQNLNLTKQAEAVADVQQTLTWRQQNATEALKKSLQSLVSEAGRMLADLEEGRSFYNAENLSSRAADAVKAQGKLEMLAEALNGLKWAASKGEA